MYQPVKKNTQRHEYSTLMVGVGTFATLVARLPTRRRNSQLWLYDVHDRIGASEDENAVSVYDFKLWLRSQPWNQLVQPA